MDEDSYEEEDYPGQHAEDQYHQEMLRQEHQQQEEDYQNQYEEDEYDQDRFRQELEQQHNQDFEDYPGQYLAEEYDQDNPYGNDFDDDILNRQMRKLNSEQKTYLNKINEEATIQYFKQNFQFKKNLTTISESINRSNLRIDQLFVKCSEVFKKYNIILCQISVVLHRKVDQSIKDDKNRKKVERIPKEIIKILQFCSYDKEKVKEYPHYNFEQLDQIDDQKFMFIHFIVKIQRKAQDQNIIRIKNTTWKIPLQIRNQRHYLDLEAEDAKHINQDYLTVQNKAKSYALENWGLACKIKDTAETQQFYCYFSTNFNKENKSIGNHSIIFSRPLDLDKDLQNNIVQLNIYSNILSNAILKATIKIEQIHSIEEYKNEYYVYLSSPPVYQMAFIPERTYSQPNYIKYWQRIENFIYLKHRLIKDNQILRLYLYSNSFIHLRGRKDIVDQLKINMELIKKQSNFKNRSILKEPIVFNYDIERLNSLYDFKWIQEKIRFIKIKDHVILTEHKKWKVLYQILLLIRFNVLKHFEIQDFLSFLQINNEKLDEIIYIINKECSSYTNRKAIMNYHRKNTYKNFLIKLHTELKQVIYKTERYKQKLQKDITKSVNEPCLIYKVHLTPSGIIINPLSMESQCRLIRQYQNQRQFFIKLTVGDDNNDKIKNNNYLQEMIKQELQNIRIFKKVFKPLGWSGSQLKESSMWYVSQIEKDQGQLRLMTQTSILGFLGNFNQIFNPAKKAARIGQAFSSSYHYDSSNITVLRQKDDISLKGYKYTDGIGKISQELLQQIKLSIFHDSSSNKHLMQTVCCIQIRHKGAKGVLLLNKQIPENTIVLRESMVKYESNHPNAKKYLDIVDWNKYRNGYINRQNIILLKSLNIHDDNFFAFQKEYISNLKSLSFKSEGNIFKHFQNEDQNEEGDNFMLTLNVLINNGFPFEKEFFFQELLNRLKYSKLMQLKKKSKILVQKSARLIGVIDDYNILKSGELFCYIKENFSSKESFCVSGDVIITRDPSLNPADLRKCKCIPLEVIEQRFKDKGIAVNYFSKYYNCVVFPKQGQLPLTSQISGSDLDGDLFFISWDKRLIIQEQSKAEVIDQPNKKQVNSLPYSPGYKEFIDFFMTYADSDKLGIICNAHLIHADQSWDRKDSEKYAKNPICLQLAREHGKAVDFAKTGIIPQIKREHRPKLYPDFMQKWNKNNYKSKSVLGKLYRNCKTQLQNFEKQKNTATQYLNPLLVRNFNQKQVKDDQIKKVFHQLKEYEFKIEELRDYLGSYDEYELYLGITSKREDFNAFGKRKISTYINQFKQEQLFTFFNKKRDLKEKYEKIKAKSINKHQFEAETINRAVLYYLISYISHFMGSKFHDQKFMKENVISRQFIERIMKEKDRCNFSGSLLGFSWFVIPKLMINIMSNTKKEKK